MDQKKTPQKNNGQGGNNQKRNGVLVMLAWALALTIGLNFLSSVLADSSSAGAMQEVTYDCFMDLAQK